MRKQVLFLISVAGLLVTLSGCDNYSLLDGFDRTGGLSLAAASSSLEQGGSTDLYAAGGKPPYSWMLVEKDLAYLDAGNRLGSIAGSSYTAGNSIGTIAVLIRDNAGNTAEAVITVLPPPPTGLTVDPSGANKLVLNWAFANPGHISGFVVYRALVGTPFVEVTTLGSGITTYLDTGLTPNTTYSYYLQAVNGTYRSRPSGQDTDTTNL